MPSRVDTLVDRHRRAMHGVQSALAYELSSGLDNLNKDKTPKSLRLGVNAAMVDHGALATLLIRKGLITEEEYLEAIAEAAEAELARYEERYRPLRFG